MYQIVPAETPAGQERRPRRTLTGPAVYSRARHGSRCAICARYYPRGARIAWLPGSGPVHAECAPDSHQDGPRRAALWLAAHAADAAELADLLAMVGLIPASRQWTRAEARARAAAERNAARVNAGETYRSQAPSTYRRKSAPRGAR